jgi:hypothetical protein
MLFLLPFGYFLPRNIRISSATVKSARLQSGRRLVARRMKFVIINQWAYFPRVQLRKVQLILLKKFALSCGAGVFSALVVFLTAHMLCRWEFVWSLGTSADRPHSLFW